MEEVLTERRFDAYIAGDCECAAGEVLFLGPARVVIKHKFASIEEWNRERNLPLRSGDESRRKRGTVPNSSRPGEFKKDDSDKPPAGYTKFYGADHV